MSVVAQSRKYERLCIFPGRRTYGLDTGEERRRQRVCDFGVSQFEFLLVLERTCTKTRWACTRGNTSLDVIEEHRKNLDIPDLLPVGFAAEPLQ